MVAVGIVLLGRTEADLDVGDAAVGLGGGGDGSVLGGDAEAAAVGDGVADEVGLGLGGVGGAERGHGAMEFGIHGLEQDVVSGGLGGR